jgi:GNAT superfamily N-acetyltransferase
LRSTNENETYNMFRRSTELQQPFQGFSMNPGRLPIESEIVQARTQDCERLTTIAWQSKKHWGYPPELMELWREGLTITPDMIESHTVSKIVVAQAEAEPEIAGFTVLIAEDEILWIEHLWILPEFIGHGLGRRLVEEALGKALHPPYRVAKVVSDPNAEAFYRRLGFETESETESFPKGRFLPVMARPSPEGP